MLSVEREERARMPYDGSGWTYPAADGLYDPSLEKDACGVGFIVHIDGRVSHSVLESGQELSRRMTHRGACSADNDSGDGAGALLGIPHSFYQSRVKEEFSLDLPPPGRYGTGLIFLDPASAESSRSLDKSGSL